MNKIIKIYCILLCILHGICPSANAKIVQASSCAQIKAHIQEPTTTPTLLLLDIDYVLLAPQDKILRYAGETSHLRGQYFQALRQDFKGQKIRLTDGTQAPLSSYLLSIILANSSTELVAKDMPEWINKIRHNPQMTVLGFTANQPHRLGIIPNKANFFIQKLHELGYQFMQPHHDIFKTPMPDCEKSIVFTGQKGKGNVMVTLLQHLKKKPQHIILIDDRLENLIDVEQAIQPYGIAFTGIHYDELFKKQENINHQIVHHQFKTLRERHLWLSDEEAQTEIQAISKTQTSPKISTRK